MIFGKKVNIPSVLVEQMKKIEDVAINRFGVETPILMENAGRNVAMLARKILGRLYRKEVVILIGKGNNGGDGLVAARFLNNWGAKVSCFIADHPDKHKKMTSWHIGVLKSMYVNVVYQTEQTVLHNLMKNSVLVIDSLLGYNIEGDPRNFYKVLIDMANNSGKKILSVDNPSGLNLSTGEPMSPCIKADYTMTFNLPKNGLLSEKARQYVGELWIGDIGLPHEVYEFLEMDVPKLFEEKDIIKI